MTPEREQLLQAIAEMSERYPDWRLGQMLANLTFWSHNPKDATEAAAVIWDVEDDSLTRTITEHLARHREEAQQETNLTPQPTS